MVSYYNKIYNTVYVLGTSIMLLFFFSSISSKYGSINEFLSMVLVAFSGFLVFFSVIILGIQREKILGYILFTMLISSYIYVRYVSNKTYVGYDWSILYFISLFIALKNDNKKLKYVSLFSKIILMASIVALAVLNIIPNLEVYRWGSSFARHTLGFSSPNTLGAVYLAIIIESLLLYRNTKYNYLLYVIFFPLSFYFYRVTDSRTSMYLAFAILALTLFIVMFKEFKNKIPGHLLISIIFCLIIGLNLLLPFFFGKTEFVDTLNNMFTGRIAMSKYFVEQNGIHVLGTSIPNNESIVLNSNFFFKEEQWLLDSAYFRILLNQGLVFFAIFLLFLYKRLVLNPNTIYHIVCIFAIFIYGAFERYAFNPFIFGTLLLEMDILVKRGVYNKIQYNSSNL